VLRLVSQISLADCRGHHGIDAARCRSRARRLIQGLPTWYFGIEDSQCSASNSRRGTDLSVLYDEVRRDGAWAVDLPVDHRRAWRAPVGVGWQPAWIGVSPKIAGRASVQWMMKERSDAQSILFVIEDDVSVCKSTRACSDRSACGSRDSTRVPNSSPVRLRMFQQPIPVYNFIELS
jgi:hypothetical protein